jgi:hypothetical protein
LKKTLIFHRKLEKIAENCDHNTDPMSPCSGSAGLEAFDSTASSPMTVHRSIPEELSVKAFKKVLEGPTQREREEEEAKKKKVQVRSPKEGRHFLSFFNHFIWSKHCQCFTCEQSTNLYPGITIYLQNKRLWVRSFAWIFMQCCSLELDMLFY